MFGIGLPEMIVILAVALIVVGPDKLPELARSLAKGMNELKRTMNQVKENLSEETRVISSVQEDLKKTAGELTQDLLEDRPVDGPPTMDHTAEAEYDEADVIDLQPLEQRPWEKDANADPVPFDAEAAKDEPAGSDDDPVDQGTNNTSEGRQKDVP
jgi:sec-independent protein translocase protein TatB